MPLQTNMTQDEQVALNAVLQSRSPASYMRLEYYAGSELLGVTSREDELGAVEAEWGRPDAERPALEFTGMFREIYDPDDLRREVLRVDLIVETALGGFRFRRFTGPIRRVAPSRIGTRIQAASGGYWLDKIRFDETVAFTNVEPSEVVWRCVLLASEAGAYDYNYADIEYVPGPKVRREEFLVNTKVDKLARPIAAAVEEGDLFFRDSPYNAPMCHRARGPAEADEVVWTYRVGEDVDEEEWEPETDGDEYDAVLCYRVTPDGQIEYLFDPIKIEGSVAPERASYEINISDESDTSNADAYHLATEAALRLRDGESTTTQTLPWIHPLLVDGDFVAWTQPFDTGTRAGTRHWIGQVNPIKETSELEQEQSLIMVRRREEYDPVPTVLALPQPRQRGA